jgi:PAT family beta-lactamase induction signal transducer AmpG
MNRIINSLKNKLKRTLLFFFLGFPSGTVFFFLASTLNILLKESGVSTSVIGLFAATAIPYSLKFLIAPICDNFKIFYLEKKLGHHRAIAIVAQIALIILLVPLTILQLHDKVIILAIAAFCMSLAAVVQDIGLDAYRAQIAKHQLLGTDISSNYFGFRTGMLFSGALALIIAEYYNWNMAIFTVIISIVLGIIGLFYGENVQDDNVEIVKTSNVLESIFHKFLQAIKAINFTHILIFTTLYKICDSSLHSLSNIYFIEQGFSKIEIASIAKAYWLIFSFIGAYLSGFLIDKYGIYKVILASIIMQIICCGSFSLLPYRNITFLIIVVSIDSFTSSLSTVVTSTYRTSVCRKSHSSILGTQTSLISSVSSIVRIISSMCAGLIVQFLGWKIFFIIICSSCIISYTFVLRSKKFFQKIDNSF